MLLTHWADNNNNFDDLKPLTSAEIYFSIFMHPTPLCEKHRLTANTVTGSPYLSNWGVRSILHACSNALTATES